MRVAEPGATDLELRNALVYTGTAIGSFGPCAVGGGLVEAVAAV